ncbi:MAG: hypothetical protein ACRDCS_01345 [Tannerellaceae bacterium]
MKNAERPFSEGEKTPEFCNLGAKIIETTLLRHAPNPISFSPESGLLYFTVPQIKSG